MNKITALLPILQKVDYYVPNRNFLPFGGKPMYQFMIEKLLSVPQIEKIVINTDSDEVKQFCKSNGKIVIIDRPESLTGDDIMSDRITEYDLGKVSGEHFIEVQSFNPILTKRSLETAINQYFDFIVNAEETYFDSLFSLQRYEMRNYDLDTRQLKDDYMYTIIENRILHVFSRTNFRKQGNKKIGKQAMGFEIMSGENTLVDSDTNYEIAKLIYANKDKFKEIYYSEI